MRATKQFDSIVVEQLRWCFDQTSRMSALNIEKHLKMHFGLYAGPAKCLRAAQISSWISSEVSRRKKAEKGLSVAAVMKAAEEVSIGAVEADEVGVELACIELVKIRNLEAMRERLDGFKGHWRARRPRAQVENVPEEQLGRRKKVPRSLSAVAAGQAAEGGATSAVEAQEPEIEPEEHLPQNGSCQKKRKPTLRKVPASAPLEPVVEVTEVINKRGRRCEYEYECRWSNKGADETSWESADELLSLAARQAVQAYEDQLKGTSRIKLLMGQLICEKCNAVIDKSDSLYPSKYECKDAKTCAARAQSGFGLTTRSSRRR